MLPPIHRASNNNAVSGSSASPGPGTFGLSSREPSNATMRNMFQAPPILAKGSTDRNEDLDAGSHLALEKLRRLEQEHEVLRDELQHMRLWLSNSQQEREEEKQSISTVMEELQRLALAFNSKLQADATNQQREQQKAALLLAEVARLGQHIGKVDSSLQLLADDTRQKLDQQPQQSIIVPQSSSPTVRHQDFRRQQHLLDDAHRDLQQLRLEWEAERNDWRRRFDDHDAAAERARRQLAAEVQNRLAADKIETVTRLTDECRQHILSADAKRGALLSGELSHVNDHFAELERWIHGELGSAKRAIQMLAADTDGKFHNLAQCVVSGFAAFANASTTSDEEFRGSLLGLHDAMSEMAFRMQRKLASLESVLPLEVKARQQGDNKLRQKVDELIKTTDAARALVVKMSKQMKNIAHVEQVQSELDAVRQEMESLVSASDAKMATKLSEYVEIERNQMANRLDAALEEVKSELAKMMIPSEAPRVEVEVDETTIEMIVGQPNTQLKVEGPTFEVKGEEPIGSNLLQLVEQTCARHDELLVLQQKLEQQQQQSGQRVDELERWMATHAGECRGVYDYVTWSLEAIGTDSQVRLCVDAMVDRIADADCGWRLGRLESAVATE